MNAGCLLIADGLSSAASPPSECDSRLVHRKRPVQGGFIGAVDHLDFRSSAQIVRLSTFADRAPSRGAVPERAGSDRLVAESGLARLGTFAASGHLDLSRIACVARFRRMVRVALLCSLLSLVAPTQTAWGETPPNASSDTADGLFRAGRAALKRGELSLACDHFHASHRLEPAVGTELNLASCEEKLSHLLAARKYYQSVVSRVGPDDGRRMIALERLEVVQARLPRLTVRLVEGAPAGVRVSAKGRSVMLGQTEAVDPGAYSFSVSAPGHALRQIDVVVSEGETRELLVEPGPALESPPLVAPEPQPILLVAPEGPLAEVDERSGTQPLGLALGAFGIANVAAGSVLGIMSLQRASLIEDRCPGGACNDLADVDLANEGAAMRTWSFVTLGVGAAALGVGAYFTFWADREDGSEAQVAVTPLEDGASLSVSGKF